MKSQGQVKQRLRKLTYRYLKRRLQEHLSPRPNNCIHNFEHAQNGNQVRLCMLGADDPENWPGNVCDTVKNAETCPFFKSIQDKEQIQDEFRRELQDEDVLFRKYRDIAMLTWVLEEKSPDLSWWQKLKLKLT